MTGFINSAIFGIVALALAGCGGGANTVPELKSAAEKLSAAKASIDAGNHDEALSLLNDLIEDSPSVWAYKTRAKLYLDMGEEEKALADCEAGLQVQPGFRELEWMAAEIKKPVGERFKGRFANPPGKP